MHNQFLIDGIIPILPTPFTADEAIDWPALAGLVEFAIAGGAWGVCLPAYASEFYKLSDEERRQVAVEAVRVARGRVPVIGQVNHPSARLAAQAAAEMQRAGASAICTAVPRLFGMPETDLALCFDRILSAIEIPLIIQDFNPTGPSVSVPFIADLHRAHPHFRYVKLEEPMMAGKVEAIRQATAGEVGVIEGWGGMYMMDLMPAGVCGVMPSLGLVDLLDRCWRLGKRGLRDEAYDIFQAILPQIVYSLQHMELYHHAEKLLLRDRGVLPSPGVRSLRLTLREHDEGHIRFLNSKILALLERLNMPANPAAAGRHLNS
jgi:4-hydroxy-tetrahydrodipicolinate synthase